MKAARGVVNTAAKILGCTPVLLRTRIGTDPQLRAAFLKTTEAVEAPDELQVALRKEVPEKITDNQMAEVISHQDREILRHGLSKSGIKDSTIDKLRTFDGFAANTGKFLAGSLDLTHRMMIYQTVALFERAEKIKLDYLDDDSLCHEARIEWQRAYNEIAELVQKSYDRTLQGTQVLVNIMRAKKDDEGNNIKKRKPSFVVKEAEPKK